MTEPAPQPPPAAATWQPPPERSAEDWRRSAGPLSGSIVAAAVIMLVMAVLTGLLAAIILFSSSIVADPAFQDPLLQDPMFEGQSVEAAMAMAQAFFYVFAGIVLAAAVAHLAAGIGVLKRRNWARILGMVLAGLGIVLTGATAALSLLSAGQPLPPSMQDATGVTQEQYAAMMTGGLIFGIVISIVVLLAYGYVFFLLLARGREFSPQERIG